METANSGQLKTMPTSVRDVGSGCPIAVVPPSITNNQVSKMRLRVSSHCYELRQVIFTHSKLFIRQPPTKQFVAEPDPKRVEHVAFAIFGNLLSRDNLDEKD